MLSAVVPPKAGTAVFLIPLAENRAADPYMSSAQLDRGHEIRAHAHGQQLEPVAPRDLSGEREMRARRFVERRNAQQPGNGQAVGRAALVEKRVGVLRQHAGLLRLGAGVDLDQQKRRAPLLGDLLAQRLSPAISSYPPPGRGWTMIGCNTPRCRIESASAVSEASSNSLRGWDGLAWTSSRPMSRRRPPPLCSRRGCATWHASPATGSSICSARLIWGLIVR